jgi:hypothetical protein
MCYKCGMYFDSLGKIYNIILVQNKLFLIVLIQFSTNKNLPKACTYWLNCVVYVCIKVTVLLKIASPVDLINIFSLLVCWFVLINSVFVELCVKSYKLFAIKSNNNNNVALPLIARVLLSDFIANDVYSLANLYNTVLIIN